MQLQQPEIKILPLIFRQSNHAVVGVAILAGQITPKSRLINNSNERIGEILQIQDSGESLPLAKVGQEIAISIKGPTVGRQIKEGDELYVDLSENQAMQLQQPEIKILLTGSDMLALQDLIEIKRKYSGQTFRGIQ